MNARPSKYDNRPKSVSYLEKQTPNIRITTIPTNSIVNPVRFKSGPIFLMTNLEVILLPLLPLRLALRHNPLTQPLCLKAFIQLGQILNDQSTSSHDSFLGCNSSIGLNTEFKSSEERVGDFVRGEHDGGVLEEALREEVAERVVFFVECEDGRVGDACSALVL
jgi:hypothetical protein